MGKQNEEVETPKDESNEVVETPPAVAAPAAKPAAPDEVEEEEVSGKPSDVLTRSEVDKIFANFKRQQKAELSEAKKKIAELEDAKHAAELVALSAGDAEFTEFLNESGKRGEELKVYAEKYRARFAPAVEDTSAAQSAPAVRLADVLNRTNEIVNGGKASTIDDALSNITSSILGGQK